MSESNLEKPESNQEKSESNQKNVFEITRIFDAPSMLVWKTWTEPSRIAQWMGPRGSEQGRILRHELQPGGVLLSSMIANGHEMWAKHVYREVVPFSRLVWVHSFSNENGELTRHPMAPTWPLELLTTLTLEEIGNQTKLTLTWVPINATDEERKTFSDAKLGMHGGWTGSFDRLSDYLTEIRA